MGHSRLSHIKAQLDSADLCDRISALLSLESLPSTDAVPLLKQAIADDQLSVRTLAVRGLGARSTPESYALLVGLLTEDDDYEVRAAAAAALGHLGDGRATQVLIRVYFEDTAWLVQCNAVVSLGLLKADDAYDLLVRALAREEVLLQQAAISALADLGHLDGVPHLLPFAKSEDWLLRQRLAVALGLLPSPQSQATLQLLQRDNHNQVAEAATASLQRLQQRL